MTLYTYSVVEDAAREHVLSARPEAPVIEERESRPRTVLDPPRRVAARTLRQLADRLEPCPNGS
jgi:hypothetical protein